MILALIFLIQRDTAETGGGMEQQSAADEGPELHILTGSGFYDEDIRIEVELEKEGKVFYTSDGSMPAKEEGGSTLLYKEPVFLAAEEEESVEVYRFLAIFQDGTESEIVTNTYFMGKNIKDRYDTMIISLAAEDDGSGMKTAFLWKESCGRIGKRSIRERKRPLMRRLIIM